MDNKHVGKVLSMAGLAALFTGCFSENKQYFESLGASGSRPVSADLGASGTTNTNDNGQPGGEPGGGGTGGGGGIDPNDPVVCDPFVNDPLLGGGGGSSDDPALHGLRAKMKYIEASRINSVPHNNLQNYLDNGTVMDANFYFAQLNTPTRKFSDGFDIGNGEKLKDKDGNVLVENFVLEYETHIRLPKGSPNKKVQFALLADDGARMYVKVGDSAANGWREVVYDDMTHPTKMGCGVEAIEVSADQDLHVKVEYFQGPRYHIALALMWRVWDLQDPVFNPSDESCGKYGNDLFWDSAYTPSREQPAFLGLLDRGWSVVPPEAFYLDGIGGGGGAGNPCVQ